MALEDQLWRIAHKHAADGRALALCTIVASRGSTPRELGARMLIGEDGWLAGTVGGGCGEADVAVRARRVVKGEADPGEVEVDLSGDFEQTAIQACGGTMDVVVERIGARQLEVLALLAEAESSRRALRLAARLPDGASKDSDWRVLDADTLGDLPREVGSLGGGEAPALVEVGDGRWFIQTIGTREEVVIVGSGHVAQPLARIAAFLGYRVVVADDRPEYTTRQRFPEASEVLVGDHAKSLAELKPGQHSHVVIITRGHQHDEASLREALKHAPAYVGMIGSKRRAIGTVQRLAKDGVSPDSLARVHTPIGLDIGAQTPEEIALAVLAEIVCRRRGGTGRPLMDLRSVPKSRHGHGA